MSDAPELPSDDGRLLRGGVVLVAAKGVAVVGGFALYWLLARVFTGSMGEVAGTAALGVWGTTFGVINPIAVMASAGTAQVMSRLVASRGALGGAVFGRAARTQGLLVLAVFGLLVALAPAIAESVLNDAAYAAPLRLAALIPLFYAFRALYEGYLNGTQRFREQATLDVGSTLLRLLLVLGGAAAGFGALGAIGGFVLAAVGMAGVAWVWVRPERGGGGTPPSAREILAFQAQVIGVTLATQYVINVDLLAVKALASPDPAVADRLAGYYTAAQKLAQVPLSIALGIATLLFSYVASDHARAGEFVRKGMRALLILMVPSAALLAANAHETLVLVFPTIEDTLRVAGDAPSAASGVLALLAVGYVPCALFLTATTLITASGRPGLAASIAAATLVLAWLGVRALTPVHGPVGAALGASGAFVAGLAACLGVLARRFGAPIPGASCVRIMLAGGALAWLAVRIPSRGVLLLVEDGLLAVVFLLLLWVLREIRVDEVRQLLDRLRPGRERGGTIGPR